MSYLLSHILGYIQHYNNCDDNYKTNRSCDNGKSVTSLDSMIIYGCGVAVISEKLARKVAIAGATSV